MQYPPKFPNEACAAVEAELIRAGRLHDKRKREWESDWTFPERQSLLTCILSIFLAYAREAIALGKSGVWRVDQVRQEAMEGLRLITIEMSSQKGYHSFLEIGSGHISTETHRELETAPEWRQFEDELLGLAEQRAAKNSQQTAPIAVIPESAQTAIAEPPSWKDLQAEFLQYAVEHADLRAVWSWVYTHDDQFAQRPPRGQWTFSGGLPASQHLFKEVARRAAQRAPNSSDAEPWQRWLDVMRSEGYSRKLLPRRVSMNEFRVAVESGEYAPLPPGFESQQIEHVFKSSADFCYVRSLAEASLPSPSRPVQEVDREPSASSDGGPIDRISDERSDIGVTPFSASRPAVADRHLDLLELVLRKWPTTLEKWAAHHKLARTTVFDWKALRSAGESLKGKVSSEKCIEIELAIKKDAEALGLITRTDSD